MKAVVMAGGAGSRLRPLTMGRPKPMVPLVNKPVMGHIIDLLKRHNLNRIAATLQYMANDIQDYFGDGSAFEVELTYFIEDEPLGTAGSVKNAEPFLDEPFLVISGDAVTDIDLSALINFHRQKGALVTIALYRVPTPLEYGVVITDEDGRIIQFLEKPGWAEVISDWVNTGIYVLEPEVLEYIPPGQPFDFSKDLFPLLLKKGAPLFGFKASGYWCDVGNIQEYVRASFDYLQGKVNLTEPGRRIAPGIWVGEGVEIAPDAKIYGPVYLGNEVKLKGGVVIQGPAVIRDYTVVDNRAMVERSIIWRNCYIGEGAEIRGAVIGRQCTIKSNVAVFEGAVLGDNCLVERGAVIHPKVRLWPGKEVEAGATVKSTLIWGGQARRTLFGRYGVTGVVNVDLTPEFASKLGAAYGATLPKGSTVTINRDPHRSPRMIKRAIISGLPSAGINVLDLRTVPIPVARYYTRITYAAGGIHVRLSPYDQRVVDIKFFDHRGLDLSRSEARNVERTFFQEDFRRAYLNEIGLIEYAPDAVERYRTNFLAALNVEAIRIGNFRIVVDYANSPNALVLPDILNELKVNAVTLNASLDENKLAILREEFEAALEQLRSICSAVKADLGVRLEVGGEKLFVVDDKGRLLPDIVFAAAMTELAFRTWGSGKVAVPVNLPLVFEKIASRYGGEIIRTKVDLGHLMETVEKENAIIAADGTGNILLPRFHPAPDALFALATLLEFLALQKAKLSEIVDSIPPYYLMHREVPCSWESKGQVMRLLNEQYKDTPHDNIDGIRIWLNEESWVLVHPDPDMPSFHVYAESSSRAEASNLAERYARIIEGFRE